MNRRQSLQLVALAAGGALSSARAAPAAGCPALLRFTFPRLQDESPQPLCQYAGRVILAVNTASYCAFTPQYKGLEELYLRYRDQGFVVLGFPSNDFRQESGNNQQIADFCQNTYGVKFPMFAKTAVRGSDANPFFRELAQQAGRAPLWNFHKYLIGRDGRVVANYTSLTRPDDPDLLRALQQQLAQH